MLNYILFGGFLILYIENHFKPRVYLINKKEIIIWFTWKGNRKFWKF